MPSSRFSPGFRMSLLDVMVLIVGAVAATAAFIYVARWIGLAIAFVVLHFFLFCNIVRMSRPLELTWATIFAALAIIVVVFERLNWPVAFGLSAASTVILVFIQILRPSYHGVGWRSVNPRLPEWWRINNGEGVN